jgi:hypothetical protein
VHGLDRYYDYDGNDAHFLRLYQKEVEAGLLSKDGLQNVLVFTTCTRTYIMYACIYAYVHVHVCMHVCVHAHADMYIWIYMYVHVSIHTCIYNIYMYA